MLRRKWCLVMTTAQFLKNLETPDHIVDVVLDTDAYNEIDDQYAIAYILRAPERIRVKGFCSAPFVNARSRSPKEGMLRSYDEIIKLLKLLGREELSNRVYKGSTAWLTGETTPQVTDASRFMAELAESYTADNPLYIVAIGAITNVASAMLMNPGMKERCVVIWLGGHGHHVARNNEFNMKQDIAAARVVMNSGVPFVQLPCGGVVAQFATSQYELEHWLLGKNALCDYLVQNIIEEAEKYAAGLPWTRVIWDVTAVAWLLNDDHRFMSDELRHMPVPEYDQRYSFDPNRHFMKYISSVNRDKLFADLFDRLTRE